MLKHKRIDRICAVAIILAVAITLLFINGEKLGIAVSERVMGYESRLFDTTRVHTLDIIMADWEGFLETCTNEDYVVATVVIDGEAQKNVGIRAKGNSSLSSVSSYDNNRYSFKVEFDQYNTFGSYYGLDKLSLNNIIQDSTYLKDYLSYTLMREMGVASPLCSFVYITVNGEEWGLYLAVEGVEDSFLARNFGADYGELYKPDSLSMGANRGQGQNFNMDDFMNQFTQEGDSPDAGGMPQMPEGFDPATMFGEMPEGFDPTAMFGQMPPETANGEAFPNARREGMNRDRFAAMSSADVMLQYIDDNPDSYGNIFGNAKTDITDADKARLIQSLKTLTEGEDIESVVDVDAVIRYFVVHNFLCNDDSYTGTMIHNYYLYEEDGVLSMLPWDYNLSFGGFGMGGQGTGTSSGATSAVNAPIDSLVSSGDISTRPMAAWIFANEAYTELYHQYYAEFAQRFFAEGELAAILDSVIALISPYVEKDPTAFCTYAEFTKAVETLRTFCALRGESITGQLNGSIPSTTEGQREDSAALVDASAISTSDMGSMGGGGMWGGMARENRAPAQGVPSEPRNNPPPDAQKEEADSLPSNISQSEAEPPTSENGQSNSQRSMGLLPAGSSQSPGGMPPSGNNTAQAVSSEAWILLAATAAVLLAGLVFAAVFKKP